MKINFRNWKLFLVQTFRRTHGGHHHVLPLIRDGFDRFRSKFVESLAPFDPSHLTHLTALTGAEENGWLGWEESRQGTGAPAHVAMVATVEEGGGDAVVA